MEKRIYFIRMTKIEKRNKKQNKIDNFECVWDTKKKSYEHNQRNIVYRLKQQQQKKKKLFNLQYNKTKTNVQAKLPNFSL